MRVLSWEKLSLNKTVGLTDARFVDTPDKPTKTRGEIKITNKMER